MSLYDIAYGDGTMQYPTHRKTDGDARLADYLTEARAILAATVSDPRPEPFGPLDVTADFEELRWFPLPDEVDT